MFDAIVAKLGTEVKISDVRSEFPSMVGYVMREGKRVSRGVYDIAEAKSSKPVQRRSTAVKVSDIVTPVFAEPEIETSKRVIEVVDNIGEENLVPSIDPLYVPWGCYNVVRQIISSDIFAPMYIIGESGNGKTMGVEQACAKMKREVIVMNITNETSEEDLIGSYILQNGNMIWRDGPVIVAMRRGAVLCLDEIDQARTSIMALQTVAQGKPYFIKKTNELVAPRRGFCLIGTANTKGDGVAMDKFAGAQVLNEAFLERFNIVFEQEYPTEAVERKILSQHSDNANLNKRLTSFAKITRAAYASGGVTHCLTTRRLVQICQNIKIFGDEMTGVKFAVARFSSENQRMFLELYAKLVSEQATVQEVADAAPAEPVPF